MARNKLAPGSHGEITYQDLPDGRVRGTLRFRRLDGSYGKLRVRASSNAAARRSLMSSVEEQFAPLGQVGVLSPDSWTMSSSLRNSATRPVTRTAGSSRRR
jgi:hypothetical protein